MSRCVVTPIVLPPQGPRGTAGQQTGFGQITYTERVVEPSDVFAPGVRQQLVFTPTTVQDFLNAPFVGHVFWDGERVIARAMGDLYDLTVNLIVVAQVADGQLRVDADVGSVLGPVASDTQTLFNGASEPERVTFRLRAQVLAGFMANGCALYLISSVPLTVTSETVLIAPASIRPPS